MAAREPRVNGPGDGGDGDDRVREAGTESARDRHRQDERRERKEDLRDAHQRLVHEAASIAGDQPHQRAEDPGQRDDDDPDHQ